MVFKIGSNWWLTVADRWEIRSWRSTARPRRASRTPGPSNSSRPGATRCTCCCGPARAWSRTTVSAGGSGASCMGHLLITRRHAAVVWMRLLAERSSPWTPCMCLLIPLLLCQLAALIFRFGTAAYSYLFIFSSYRSELFFHPVLLHETRASLKASLLFSVCP